MTSAVLFLALLAAPAAAQLYVPFDDLELLSSGAAHVTLNGSAVLGAPDAVLTVNQTAAGVVKGVTASVSLDGALTLEIAADAAGAFSETLPIVALPLPTSTIGTNVDVAPWAVMLLTISGDAAFGMRTSFVQSFNVHADVALGPGFHVTANKGPSMSLAGQPDIAAGSSANIQVSTTLAVVYLLTAGGLPLGGPFAGVTLGADANIDPLADPWWEVDGEMDILAGYWGLGIAPLVFPVGISDFGQADGPLIGAPPTTRWAVSIDSNLTDKTSGVVPTPGGLLMAGVRGLGDTFLGRVGPDGTLLSAENSSAAGNGGQKVVCTEPTADGGCLLGGNGGGVRLDRLDAGGVKLWSKVYVHAASFAAGLVDVVALADGGFAALGNVALTASGSVSRSFVLRVDADGQVLWARDLFLGGTDPSSTAYDLAPTADGGLLLTGAVGYTEIIGGQYKLFAENMFLARLEADGDLDFAHVIGSFTNERGTCVAEGPDGRLWVGGAVAEGGASFAWVSTFDAAGQMGWSRKMCGADTGLFTVPVRALVPMVGGAQLLGDRGFGAGHDAWLAQITDGGTPISWKSLGGPAEDAPLGLRVLPDGLLVWGWTWSLDAQGSGTGADHWLLRTSVDGMLHFDAAHGFTMQNEMAQWDTPANELHYAQLLSPSLAPASFTVTDKALPFVALAASETVLTE
jgi:hypothetical protein